MKSNLLFCSLGALAAVVAGAQTPTIRSTPDGVVNNASYAVQGLPNGNIAQGSIFAIFGANLGPATLAEQPKYPLTTTLGGTSVKVTVGGASVDAIPIYTAQGQVGAVMPSQTPTGAGTVTVTYNGQTSAPHAVTVVPSSFGIFALNQKGSGPAALTDASAGFITLTSAAKPGQTIVIWGTGLGPISGDDAQDQSGGDLTNIPIQVYIGGALATVRYHGRAPHYAGLDQIDADVPSGVQGCYVSVIVVVNNVASNSTTIPAAQNGGTCSDSNGLNANDLTALASGGPERVGVIMVGRSVDTTPAISVGGVSAGGGTTKTDFADAFFYKYTPQQLTASSGLFKQASIGSCIVTTFSFGSLTTTPDPVLPTALDAGPTITVTGGTTPLTLTRNTDFGLYMMPTSSTGSMMAFIPDSGGTFTFSNGAGGADVGTLQNASIALGQPLVWSNMDGITDVPRTSNLPITWSGGAPGTFVLISGESSLTGSDPTAITSVDFSCTAPVEAHSFSVPAAVLLQLPAGGSTDIGGVSIPNGSLSVASYSTPQKFTAPGLDIGYAMAYFSNGKSVNYK